MNSSPGNMTVSTVGAGLLVLAGLFLVGLIVLYDPPSLNSHPYILPILIGLIAFPAMIFTILFASRVTHSIGADSSAHAFGMPPGSIRAILATGFMVLVLIFGVFTITIAEPDSKMQTIHRISIADDANTTVEMLKYIKQYPQPYLLTAKSRDIAKGTGGEIIVQREVDNASSVQLAQQVLTMLATALTAIVGFYFGSRTANEPETSNKIRETRRAEATVENNRKRLDTVVADIEKYGGEKQIRGSIGDYSADEKTKQARFAAFDTWLAKIPAIRAKLNKLENIGTVGGQGSELENSIETGILTLEAEWKKIEHFYTTESFSMFDSMLVG